MFSKQEYFHIIDFGVLINDHNIIIGIICVFNTNIILCDNLSDACVLGLQPHLKIIFGHIVKGFLDIT